MLDTAMHKTQYEDKHTSKHNTICDGHRYTQANTNNVNMTWAFIQTTASTVTIQFHYLIPLFFSFFFLFYFWSINIILNTPSLSFYLVVQKGHTIAYY